MYSARKKTFLKIIEILLLCCVAVSLFLRTRLFHIAYEYDEVFTAVTTDPTLPFSWIYSNWLLVDVHPPLFNALLWVWNHFVPYGPEIWLRIPSLIFGLGALCFAWFLFPKRYGKTVRLLVFSLLSCNLYVMYYSQHARSYMLMLLWAVPLTYSFLQLSFKIRKHAVIHWQEWMWFGVWSLLSCWSHYFGALLFGSMSVVLWGAALYYKSKSKGVFLTPCIVFILFLPWLIPNVLAQLEYQRFAGNWWAETDARNTVLTLLYYWVGTLSSMCVMAVLLIIMFCSQYMQKAKKGSFYYWSREQWLLLFVLLIFVFGAATISVKTYMMQGRYFIGLLPTIYLIISFWFVPFFRKNVAIGALFVLLLVCNMYYFRSASERLAENHIMQMSSRFTGQLWRDYFPDKDMLLVAMEGFPPASMPAMYGFYANKIYHLNIKVIDMVHMDKQTRNAILDSNPNAVMWMPGCNRYKLDIMEGKWNRRLTNVAQLGSICLIKPGGSAGWPEDVEEEYDPLRMY